MKAVQVGILAALLVCAGLLFKVYRGQQAPAPAAAPQAQAPAAAPAPAPQPVEPAAAAPVEEPAAVSEAPRHKPSPARARRARTVEVAQNHPSQDGPAPVAAPAAPAPEPTPAAAEPDAAPLIPASATETGPPPPREPHRVTIPAGTLLTVRLGETLSSDRNRPGDSFSATLDQPLVIDGFEIATRGARAHGKVLDAQPAGRVKGVSELAIQLVKLHTSDGQDVTLSTQRFAKEGPTSHKEDATKVGVGAVLGAAIGAIAGGGKGAAIGAGVGGAAGAGTVAATRGKATELPVETRVTFRLQEPITLTERLH
jgi:hypothetical protein